MFYDETIPATPADEIAAGDAHAPFATVPEAIAELRAGRMIVVCDDEDRENEGDLTIAAEFATPEAINFMATHGRGLICLALTPERCLEMGLRPMTTRNEAPHGTAFTVSVEAREGVTTGISAGDRARTIAVAIDPAAGPGDLVSPGHMFPLTARAGGVLERRGQTEAAVDLARLAGLTPAGVICEVMNDDGTMARVPDLAGFCATHGLKMVSVAALARYRRREESHVRRVVGTRMPNGLGPFQVVGYRGLDGAQEHVALIHGDVGDLERVPVHVHRADVLGDVFAITDGGSAVNAAIRWIQDAGAGVLVYLAGEDRLDALVRRLGGTAEPTVGPDFAVAAEVLADLGLWSVELWSADRPALEELAERGIRATVRDRPEPAVARTPIVGGVVPTA
ncbi:3,4-dihydroxy-2-butanone-4-phosphate synthase [Patulibacter defluvii]|uniref:3,4-dihydroxy-2-butanone-4-phosphate synthase n=1 Tax=Patulibacter defluvii TaxID=3095358 RepID=UPI002A7544F8|nr:3,4-dihydroxy-2-butanone-4-phosphate synthase [Patulibacter sp. DM4]